MNRRFFLPSLFAALLLLPHAGRAAEPAARKMVVAYVPNWIDLPVFAESIEYDKITHINIAFENPVNDAGDFSHSSKNDALIRKAKEKGVKILLSIGGGAASADKKLTARYFDLLEAYFKTQDQWSTSPTPKDALQAVALQYGFSAESFEAALKDQATFDAMENPRRTSTNAWCNNECFKDALTQQVTQRVEDLTGIPANNSEYWQLLKYEEGQEYMEQ